MNKTSEQAENLARFHAVLIALGTVFTVLGITGNIIILYIYTFKIRLPVFGLFIRALATIDLVNALYTMPSALIFKTLPLGTDVQNGLCKFIGYTSHFNMLTTGMIYIAIAVQRYQKICRPHGPQMTASKATGVIALCMTLSFIVSFPIILLVEWYPVKMGSTEVRMCSFNNETFTFQGQYNLPLLLSVFICLELLVITLVLVVMYCRVSKALRGYTNLTVTCGENLLKPTSAFAILTVVFFCSGVPVTALCMYRSLTNGSDKMVSWQIHITDLAVCLPFINCVVNLFVYSWSSGRFRAECKAALCGPPTRPTT